MRHARECCGVIGTVRLWVVRALDAAIVLYAFALIVILLIGGIDLGFFSMREAAKPILVLWILVPIRLALLAYLWPTRSAEDAWATIGSRVHWITQHTPAAIRDAAFAFAVTRIATFAIAFLVNLLFPTRSARPFDLPFESERFAEIFAAWDSGWYFD